MDAIAGINPKGDSTLRLGVEAQRRGHALWYYTPDKLTSRDGKIVAKAERVSLSLGEQYYTLGEAKEINLEEMDVVLLRQDPPFDMVYLTTTYLLEMLKKPLVVNNPASVRNHPEKLFPLAFSQFMPPTLVSSDITQIEAFYAAHGDIVIKPLYGYGGHGVELLRKNENGASAKISALLSGRAEPLMAQKFLPEVKDADRRIILIDGEFCGVFGRIPA
ncbi:MAG: glutathione synthase, partial [Alphaproteobacteria bacterium]|nr:glutathione synthase [Alphaproteobacteria bacterium]